MALASDIKDKHFPTGFIGLDVAMSGGLPVGKMTELFGDSSSGKTAFALQIINRYLCRSKREAVFFDVEQAISEKRIKQLIEAKNMKRLHVLEDSTIEDIAENTKSLGGVGMIVIDSVAAISSKLDSNYHGDSNMGKLPQLLGKFFRVVTPIYKKNQMIAININQMRTKIGMSFGAPWYTPGGKTVEYMNSVRIKISGAKASKGGYRDMQFLLYKNRYGADNFHVPMFFNTSTGTYCPHNALLSYMISIGDVTQSSNIFKYQGKVIGKSRADAVEYLKTVITDPSISGYNRHVKKSV